MLRIQELGLKKLATLTAGSQHPTRTILQRISWIYPEGRKSFVVGFTVFKNEAYFFGNYYTQYELYKVSGLVSDVEEKKFDQNKYRIYQQNQNLIIENVESTSKVTIYTLSRQVVAEKMQHYNSTKMQFLELKRGLYLVMIQYGNDKSIQKISIN